MYKQILSLISTAIFALVLVNCSGEKVSDNPVSSTDQLLVQETAGISDMGRMAIFSEVLNLTAEQQSQIQTIVEKQREDFRASCKDRENRPSWEERKALRQERYEALVKEIMPVLTPDQQAMVTEMKAAFDRGEVPAILIDKMKERFQKSRHQSGEQRMEKRVERLTAELSLTNEQQTQLREILSNARQDFSKEMQSGDTDREMRQELFRQHFEMVDAQIRSILNETQLQKYETLKAEMQQRRNEHFKED